MPLRQGTVERHLRGGEARGDVRARKSAVEQTKNNMKTNIIITDEKTNIASFEPVAGLYDLNMVSSEMEEITPGQIEEAIAAELTAKHGFEVEVAIFHAITDSTPSAGSFLATRK